MPRRLYPAPRALDGLVASVLAGDYPPRIDAAVDAAMAGDATDGALCQCEAAAAALALLDQASLPSDASSEIAEIIKKRFPWALCMGCGE